MPLDLTGCRGNLMAMLQEFLQAVGQDLGLCADVVRSGFDAYYARHSQTAVSHSKRSRASLIHDYMVEFAVKTLPYPRFRLVTSRQRNLFNVEDKILIQFRKLNPELKPSNIQTQQAELFDMFGEVDGLPGISSRLPLITVGYLPKPYFSGIEGIFATHVKSKKPDWILRLDDGQSANQLETSPIIPVPDEPSATTPSRIANRRKQRSQQRTGND